MTTEAENQKRLDRERRIVRHMIRTAKEAGWHVESVHDGEERVKTKTEEEAMDCIFSVDDSTVRFINANGARHAVSIIAGNDHDIICDWSYYEDDPDGFNAMMDRVTDYASDQEGK